MNGRIIVNHFLYLKLKFNLNKMFNINCLTGIPMFTIQQRYKYYFLCCIILYMCVFILVRIYPSALFFLFCVCALFTVCAFFQVRFFLMRLYIHMHFFPVSFFPMCFSSAFFSGHLNNQYHRPLSWRLSEGLTSNQSSNQRSSSIFSLIVWLRRQIVVMQYRRRD